MKYRVAAVSYINTLPLLRGLQSPDLRDDIDVILAHPARCADLLINGEVDIALCPVGALPALGDYHVITDYCIGCEGPVRTVSIYSNRPFNELAHIVLSSESRTSNLLVQMLDTEFWKYGLTFSAPSSVSSISPTSSLARRSFSEGEAGFLHIGDICFEKEKEFAYRTDLGQSWKEWTGLPFAFACWVSRVKIDEEVIQSMNLAFADGVRDIDHLAFQPGMDSVMLREYLKKNISYGFDDEKKKALGIYLNLTRKYLRIEEERNIV